MHFYARYASQVKLKKKFIRLSESLSALCSIRLIPFPSHIQLPSMQVILFLSVTVLDRVFSADDCSQTNLHSDRIYFNDWVRERPVPIQQSSRPHYL